MRLLDPTFIRDTVDYSFGDESGKELPTGYMKAANSSNQEFITKYWECVNSGKQYMTLFIDNIRLYKRDCIQYTACEQMYPNWKQIKDEKMQRLKDEDLLGLLETMPNMKFVIFTGFEDTPTDEAVYKTIPKNVIGIWGSHTQTFGGKVHPIPYGLQRVLSVADNRHTLIREMLDVYIEPNKLMYINFSPNNHPVRRGLGEHYKDMSWVTSTEPRYIHLHQYRQYLTTIKNNKFMLCPSGNADGSECHRDWETVYMRRVPIVTDTAYHHAIFDPLGVPVLYVDDLMNVTEQLLIDNNYLYDQMQSYDMAKLDYEVIYNNIINEVNVQL